MRAMNSMLSVEEGVIGVRVSLSVDAMLLFLVLYPEVGTSVSVGGMLGSSKNECCQNLVKWKARGVIVVEGVKASKSDFWHYFTHESALHLMGKENMT